MGEQQHPEHSEDPEHPLGGPPGQAPEEEESEPTHPIVLPDDEEEEPEGEPQA
jgi:hypothetical protein